jgi:hypothetical protein
MSLLVLNRELDLAPKCIVGPRPLHSGELVGSPEG